MKIDRVTRPHETIKKESGLRPTPKLQPSV